MATQKGLETAIEFTKHVMTLSGAGIAFIATLEPGGLTCLQRGSLAASILMLGLSLGAGLFVWSRATVMLGKKQFDLDDRYLRIPGLINLISFGLGVLALGVMIVIKIFSDL